MSTLRPFSLLRSEDQWRRAAHQGTSLQADLPAGEAAVQLAWEIDPPSEVPVGPAPSGAGLTFDPWCRLFRSVPEEGRVERLLWAAASPLAAAEERPLPMDLFAPGALLTPRGLAVDGRGRLFVAESGAARILVYDLEERRLLRKVTLAVDGSPVRPLGLATNGRKVWAAVEGRPVLAELDARTGPRFRPLPGGVAAERVTVAPDGSLWVLTGAGTAGARIVSVAEAGIAGEDFVVPFATDVVFSEPPPLQSGRGGRLDAVLVVARRPGQDFLRFRLRAEGRDRMPQMEARGYDGRGIARAQDGRIVFWTERGARAAVPARPRYASLGQVITFRLDSGEFQTQWGRLFVDACIPKGTAVRVHCATADEAPEGAVVPRTPPANVEVMTIHRPDLSPPMLPVSLAADGPDDFRPLYRRANGQEIPWTEREDLFETYEAPVPAPAGRFLWVTLELSGDTRLTPRVRGLRAEWPGHDLLRRLPRAFSRDEAVADFLRRYLAGPEGALADLDSRATARRALLDPQSAPPDLLPWLAGFVGLTLDERWPLAARRQLIEEAVWLFRFRGTVRGLRRFLEIYLGSEVLLIERFRLRGLGGAFAGEAVVGTGLRVGGTVGVPDETLPEDAFATHAHRFSVVLPLSLGSEQIDVVRHVLEIHRPAHTLFDLCTVDAGMRVGLGLHAGLTSRIGPTDGFRPLRLGSAAVGSGTTLGRPGEGGRSGVSRLGVDSQVG